MAMLARLHTADEMFTNAFQRWNESYRDMPDGWTFARSVGGHTVAELRDVLAKADTIDAFDRAMDNRSWTHPSCDFCSATVRVAVEIKSEWGDGGKVICKQCLTRALACFGPIRAEDAAPAPALEKAPSHAR
jgi:hypothetical protein